MGAELREGIGAKIGEGMGALLGVRMVRLGQVRLSDLPHNVTTYRLKSSLKSSSHTSFKLFKSNTNSNLFKLPFKGKVWRLYQTGTPESSSTWVCCDLTQGYGLGWKGLPGTNSLTCWEH